VAVAGGAKQSLEVSLQGKQGEYDKLYAELSIYKE